MARWPFQGRRGERDFLPDDPPPHGGGYEASRLRRRVCRRREGGKGFCKKFSPGLRSFLAAGELGAVAAHEDDLQPGPVAPELQSEFVAVEAGGHDEVGEEQRDGVAVRFPELERFLSVAALDHAVAVLLENGARERAHLLLVLDENG